MDSPVCLNPEVTRELIERIFKSSKNVETLLRFAFSSKLSFCAFTSVLKRRLHVSLRSPKISYGLWNPYHDNEIMYLNGHSNHKYSVLYFMSRFVVQLSVVNCSEWKKEENELILFLDLCKNCKVLYIYGSHDEMTLTFQERLYAMAQSVPILRTSQLFLDSMRRSSLTLPNVIELSIYERHWSYIEPLTSVDFMPNIENLQLNVCTLERTTWPSDHYFSRIKVLLIDVENPLIHHSETLLNASVIVKQFPSLQKATINLRTVTDLRFRKRKADQNSFDDVKPAFESAEFLVPVTINVTQHLFQFTDTDLLASHGFIEQMDRTSEDKRWVRQLSLPGKSLTHTLVLVLK